jgi:hypothetical protein
MFMGATQRDFSVYRSVCFKPLIATVEAIAKPWRYATFICTQAVRASWESSTADEARRGRGRGNENETRPHATGTPACRPARGSALRRQDAERAALPITGRPWPSQMPHARMWPKRRRPSRRAQRELSGWAAYETEQGNGCIGSEAYARSERYHQGGRRLMKAWTQFCSSVAVAGPERVKKDERLRGRAAPAGQGQAAASEGEHLPSLPRRREEAMVGSLEEGTRHCIND